MTRLASMLLFSLLLTSGAPGFSQPGPSPDPELSPADVVRIQLDAMARNNEPLPNAGVAIAFRFASPSNRAVTGPLDRFTVMVNSEPYRAMIGNAGADVGTPMIEAARALVPVRLRSGDGQEVRFLFVLSRQDAAPYSDCWMTDSVLPVEPEEETPVPVI